MDERQATSLQTPKYAMHESLDEKTLPMISASDAARGTVPLAFSSMTVGATKWT
jgi:hypothetical protein